MTTTTKERKVKVYQRTKVSFHCQDEDESFKNKLCLSFVTLINGSGTSCLVVIEIHPCWRSSLVKQLASSNFRGRFSHWLLEMRGKGLLIQDIC